MLALVMLARRQSFREPDRVQITKALLVCHLLVWRSHFVPKIVKKRHPVLSMVTQLESVETG